MKTAKNALTGIDRVEWWPPDRIRRLKRTISNPTVLTLLDMTAEQSPGWVAFDTIWQAVGRSWEEARADLRILTRIIQNLFPENTDGWWPVEYKATRPITYRMPEEIARIWREKP